MLLPAWMLVVTAQAQTQVQASELLRTPECRAALAALTQEEDALIARGGAGNARAASAPSAPSAPSTTSTPSNLPQRQRAAAQACLGTAAAASAASGPKRSPAPFPLPGVVRPATVQPGSVRPPAGPAPGMAPIRQAPLVTLGACDAQGCWASDGTRVQRLGPVLLGPRGYCTQTGTFLHCP